MKQSLTLTTAIVTFAFLLAGCGGETNRSVETNSQISDASHKAREADKDIENVSHEEAVDGNSISRDIVKLSSSAAQEAGIKLSKAERGEIGQSLSLPAEIRFDADRVAKLSPKVSGIISRLYAREGDQVEKGARLALIRSRELAGLMASWQKAETQLSLTKQAYAREESLFVKKITSEADLQTARANLHAAKAARDAAENELHAAGVSHGALKNIAGAADGDNANAYLTAPIAGTIVRRTVTLGETVSAGDAGAAPLFTVVDDSVVWADIAVYKQDISRIRLGAPVALKTDAGDTIAQSTVAFVLPVIDETSRTATARVIVENPQGTLRPGQFVTADLSVGASEAVIRIPDAAVQLVEDKPSVFLPMEGGYVPRAVMTGTKSGGYIEIRSGLSVGEVFVSEGAFTLKAQLEKDAFGDGHGH
jgi:cobalt-zinc-cadmium efflux system membrane fusion protein